MNKFQLDYSALEECLGSLNHLFIDIARLKHEPVYGQRRGGYCDVQVATLDSEIAGASKLVAAKKLFLGIRSSEPLRLAARLARELKVWAGLRHPHVLPLLGFYLDDDYVTAVLISEYMVYGDLKDYITKMAPTYFERLHLVRDLTDGLAYLHAQTNSIRHGDLKPGNVLVNPHHRAMLADFGLSKNLDTGPTGFTTGNDGRGTVRFSSPEVLLDGAAAQSLANDIWSWGCLVLEAMTDKIPFSDIEHEPQLIFALMKGETPCEAETLTLQLPQFSNLLVKCWTRQPDQRPKAADCLLTIQSALPSFWPASIARQMAERRKLKQPATLADDRYPQQQRLPPQQASRLPLNPSDLPNSPEVTQQSQPLPPNRPRQFHEFFAMAFKSWMDQRQLNLDTPYVDGKEVELHKLFFTVGALRGHRAVSEMSLWQFVGEMIGFPSSDGPLPDSKPEVADQLFSIYREVLADFEVHWHNSLRRLDPSSTLPLPPQLQHLHSEINLLASTRPILQQLPRPSRPGTQQSPNDNDRGLISNQITRTNILDAHGMSLNAFQPSALPSPADSPQRLAPVPPWKSMLPTTGSTVTLASGLVLRTPVQRARTPILPDSSNTTKSSTTGSTTVTRKYKFSANIPPTDVPANSPHESEGSRPKREREDDTTGIEGYASPSRSAKRARTDYGKEVDFKRGPYITAAKQLTVESSLEVSGKMIPSQDAPVPGVGLEEEAYYWWWDNEMERSASEDPAVGLTSNLSHTPSDSTPDVLTGNANANGNGNPGDKDDRKIYCYCNRVSYGEMIGCDDDQCRMEWFHLGCLGMTAPPKGEWYCDECKTRRKKAGPERNQLGVEGARVVTSLPAVTRPPYLPPATIGLSRQLHQPAGTGPRGGPELAEAQSFVLSNSPIISLESLTRTKDTWASWDRMTKAGSEWAAA